jgi:hypothetical protein
MPRITALLILGGILLAGCDTGARPEGGARKGAVPQHTTMHQETTLPEAAGPEPVEDAIMEEDSEPNDNSRNGGGRKPEFRLVTIGGLLESLRLR